MSNKEKTIVALAIVVTIIFVGLSCDKQQRDKYDTGFDDGYKSGYDQGYIDGLIAGRDEGYVDGYTDGYDDGKNNNFPEY